MVVGDILQPTHLIFILVIALLVLGPKRLPEVGRSLGRGLHEFRNSISGEEPGRSQDAVSKTTPVGAAPASSADVITEPSPESQAPAPEPAQSEAPAPAATAPTPAPAATAPTADTAPAEAEPAEHVG